MNDIQARTINGSNASNNSTASLAEHLTRLEEMILDLKLRVSANRDQVEKQRAFVAPAADPVDRAQRARAMLAARRSVTASDVQLELGVSHATAMRTIHQLARSKEGIMVFEPAGPTFRVRLWHPDEVVLGQ